MQLEKRPIYVNYKLTGLTKYLLMKAKELKKAGKLSYVWVNSDGKILVKRDERGKITHVNKIDQLNDISK